MFQSTITWRSFCTRSLNGAVTSNGEFFQGITSGKSLVLETGEKVILPLRDDEIMMMMMMN